MSRIGRMPIAVPAGVTVDIAENNKVTVKGPKGTLERVLPAEMDIKLDGDTITVSRPNDLKKMKSLHGLTRTLIHNMVVGVTEGYKKELEVNGVGYRAQKQGNKLVLALGYSHPVEMVDPEGLETVLDGQNIIVVKGIDKEKVGQYAADCFWLLSNYDECLPLVYLEAQACGIPAIGRKKGGTQETIRNRRTGFLVKSDEECLEILLNREYRYIEKDALRDFSASFDKIQATQSLIS